MSRNRFDYILSALSFINREVPYEDGLLKMRQLEESWNQNMYQQFSHHVSMFLMSPLWSGSTSGPLDLCVSAVRRIPLEKSGIKFVALSTPFCGEQRSWRARTGQPNSVWRNEKIWGRLLGSCYKCVSQYFWLETVFCLAVDFVCQRVSQPCWILVSTLPHWSRSANTGPRVYR